MVEKKMSRRKSNVIAKRQIMQHLAEKLITPIEDLQTKILEAAKETGENPYVYLKFAMDQLEIDVLYDAEGDVVPEEPEEENNDEDDEEEPGE